MLIVQISDPHIVEEDRLIYRSVDANEGLRKAVAKINAMSPQPDYVVCTGDLTNRGRASQYEVFGNIVGELKAPLLVIPGNHDDTACLARTLPDLWSAQTSRLGFIQDHASDQGKTRLILLNSMIDGEHHGDIDEERQDWLRAQLESAPGHALIFLHHPPFETGIWWMDAIGNSGGSILEDLLSEFDNVRGVFAGHIHRPVSRSFAGTLCWVAPSTAHQSALDIRDDDTLFMSETFEPAGMLVHMLDPATGNLMTHIQFTDTYAEVESLKAYVDEHRENLKDLHRGFYRKTHGRNYDGSKV
jgi:3',5'-cyclic AMP phosphodiesterase CpdA